MRLRASVYGTEGQRFESFLGALRTRRNTAGRLFRSAVRAGALDGDVLERGAIPVAESAAASYVLCRNPSSIASGSAAVRTASYGSRNSPHSA